MKKLMFLILVSVYSYAITPFSLENLKEVDVKILNKKDVISKKLEEKIKKDLISNLQKLGIKTSTEKFSNLLVQIKIDKIKNIDFVRTALIVSEDVIPLRDKSLEVLATTYKKEDSFEAEELEKDIYESVLKYLFEDFKEQYIVENRKLK